MTIYCIEVTLLTKYGRPVALTLHVDHSTSNCYLVQPYVVAPATLNSPLRDEELAEIEELVNEATFMLKPRPIAVVKKEPIHFSFTQRQQPSEVKKP